MSRTLIVLPDDSVQPILDAIDGATKSLRIKMFIFTDPSLLDAVIAAHRRGVNVRIMLNPKRRNGVSENDESRIKLEAAGIEVRDSNPAFDVTHEKSMVVDDKTAFVKSLNWETKTSTKWKRLSTASKRIGAARISYRSISSGAAATAGSALPSSSTRPSTRCGYKMSATRIR